MRGLEHPHAIERGVRESVVGRIPQLEARAVRKTERGGTRRRSRDTDFTGRDSGHPGAKLPCQMAGGRAGAAAHVEYFVVAADLGGFGHAPRERERGNRDVFVTALEQAVMQVVTEEQRPRRSDAIVMARGIVGRLGQSLILSSNDNPDA